MLAAMVSMLLIAAGCSGAADEPEPEPQDSGESAPEPEPEAEPEPEEPEADELPFAGETIRLVVGYDPGGSYDDAARWLEPHLEAATGATVVVENMPGAGSLIALNHIWTQEPDGTTIGTLNGPGTAVTLLTDSAGDTIEFELSEFTFLAGLTSEPRLMTVGADSPYESFEDMLASGETVQFGVTGSSGAGYNDAVFMQGIFGDQVDIEIVSGFESGAEAQLALIRGDVDAAFSLLGSEVAAIEAGDLRGLVVLSDERSDALPDVPAITEFDLDEETLDLLDVHMTIAELGINLVAPPNMPADLVEALRDAVWQAANEQALIDQAQAGSVAWAPRPGDEIRQAIEAALNAPDRYVELMVQAQSGG